MTPLLIIIGLAALVALLRHPTPRTHVVYVPIEVADAPAGGMGCAPLIVVAALALFVIVLLGGA